MRRLSLRKETLTELTNEDLSVVVAGSGVTCVLTKVPTIDGCFTGTTTTN